MKNLRARTLWSLAILLMVGCDGNSGGVTLGPDDPLEEALLDRSEPGGECGFPGPGPNGYGFEVGDRIAPWGLSAMIQDCEGELVDLEDFFCKRDDDYADYNRAILISIGAGWCEPCKEETEELMPEVYEPLHDQGLEIVQIIFQDDQSLPPTKSFCREWRDETFTDVLEFPVLLDQIFDWSKGILIDPQAATPVSMLIDANGNIRWKVEGQNPTDTFEQAQIVMATPYGLD